MADSLTSTDLTSITTDSSTALSNSPEGASAVSGNATTSSNPFSGGGASGFGDPLAPTGEATYNFESSELPMRTPFDGLIGLPGIDSIEDVFANVDMGDNPFAGGGEGSGNPFAGGGAGGSAGDGNPFAGGGAGDGNPFTGGSNPSANPVSENTPYQGNQDAYVGNAYESDAQIQDDRPMSTDLGSNNTDNGTGNWFYGDNNEASGNGNWSFGSGNQANGNGNWFLSGSESTPFDTSSLFTSQSSSAARSLTGDREVASDSTSSNMSGNNPVFAGGSSVPAPAGDGSIPESAVNPTGNSNTANGNGNWFFGDNNTTDGNGNWNFGNSSDTLGNGNWNLGDGNQVNGNGNRPSGDANSIEGNGNRVAGDNNEVVGNRFDIASSGTKVYGNADRYFSEDSDGNMTLVENEAASDPNMSFNFNQIAGKEIAGDETFSTETAAALVSGDAIAVEQDSNSVVQSDEQTASTETVFNDIEAYFENLFAEDGLIEGGLNDLSSEIDSFRTGDVFQAGFAESIFGDGLSSIFGDGFSIDDLENVGSLGQGSQLESAFIQAGEIISSAVKELDSIDFGSIFSNPDSASTKL